MARKKRRPQEKLPTFRPGRADTDEESLCILFAKADRFLGENPSRTNLDSLSGLIGISESFLLRMTKHTSCSARRIGRLILFERNRESQMEEFFLAEGLNDSCFRIRMDTIRFYPYQNKEQLYSELLNLLLSDSDRRIRRAAGKRIRLDFSEMFAVKTDRIPPLQQTFILDSLKNPGLQDEAQAIALLRSDHSEAALWAAWCLMKWGTLKKFQTEEIVNSEDGTMLLETAANMGMIFSADSERSHSSPKTEKRKAHKTNKIELNEIWEAENLILFLSNLPENQREDAIEHLPLEKESFRHWMETAFPLPDTDSRSALLYDMARVGKWSSWILRINEALLSGDCEIRFAAARALFVLNPQENVEELIHDPSESVRRAAARHLASMIPEKSFLSRYLRDSPDESLQDAVWQGIKDSGSQNAALCLINNLSIRRAKSIGLLISKGLEPQSILIIAETTEAEKSMTHVIEHIRPEAVDPFVAALSLAKGEARKRLLSWISASQWGETLLIERFTSGYFYRNTLKKQLSTLNSQEKNIILGKAAENSRGRVSRQLKRLIKK